MERNPGTRTIKTQACGIAAGFHTASLMTKLTPLLLLLFIGGLLTGCSHPSDGLNGLNAMLKRLETKGDGTADAVISFVNPNVYSYAIEKSEHRVYLDGAMVGTVKFDRPFAVPLQQTIEMTGTLVRNGGAGLRSGNAVPYRLESTIIIRSYGEDTLNWPTVSTGTASVVAK